ncbi:MAG: hypothetical protein WDN45_01915 [Caulobacteraceae bacterium]
MAGGVRLRRRRRHRLAGLDLRVPDPALERAGLLGPRLGHRPGFLAALAIAVPGGLLIGLLTGLSATASETAEPLLLAANSIPKIALYPVVLMLFGIGLPAKVAFGAIHGIIRWRSSP